ncbi:Kelch-repeat protein [Klebsormidium nitens]|uniref:Kelch-repeat protein n=1 Tax=Klebsormidium nitens TaxID=105231 RepID=A0A1Y1HPV7_KLENI|nr:Kelch-repeat protein [Klebsormidium nitens]|eukprot:GAQ79239.1 Kelch-repeat protein [Klebsormidium nitens]
MSMATGTGERGGTRTTMSREEDDQNQGVEQPLMDGLPNDLARRCLARASRQAHAAMQMVCRSWAAFLNSAELLELRREAGVCEECLYMLAVADDAYRWGVLTPSSGAWRRLGSVPFLQPERILKHFHTCPAGQGLLLVLGGSVWEPVSFLGASSGAWVQKLAATREVWVFQSTTSTWRPGPPMLTARRGRFACALVGNKIIVAGGSDLAGRPLCDAEVLDLCLPGEIDGFRWEALPPMSLARKDCLGAAIEGRFWAVSGRRGGIDNAFLNLHQSAAVLDLKDGTWSTVGGMWFSSEPPEHLAVFNGRIVASDSLGRRHRVKTYDESSGSWSDVGDESRGGKTVVGLAAVEKQLYAVSWDALDSKIDGACITRL